ncbi:aminopeptidase [Uliginosibacterium sp. sgz301328]|uniref:aminopeptidase n=1 Tax=Uliginosibacterium sp. sgz301328 TaxID=3243764 RepID=UPI00359DA288
MKNKHFVASPGGDMLRGVQRIAGRGVSVLAALACAACAGVGPGYYWQAMSGQIDVMWRAEDVQSIERSHATHSDLRDRLVLAEHLRAYATSELGLPDNGSYRRYADLQRPYVAWNVFATPALSMQPHEWCLPVAGCVSYLGFFSEADARAKADELRRQGMDVYVGGVPAYSTLGWFDDPLLNTFINWPEPELARLIFHELSHQLLYVKNDTEFNESFAATVEEAGVRRWLSQPGRESMLAQFEASQRRRDDFAALVLDYRKKLAALYGSAASDEDKARGKHDLIAQLGATYARIRDERWGGFAGYDRWFAQDINNATLASIGLYRGLVPGFSAVLAEEGADLGRFYARVKKIAAMPEPDRRTALVQAQHAQAARNAAQPPRAPNL